MHDKRPCNDHQVRSSKRGKDKRMRRAKKRGQEGRARSANHNDCAKVFLAVMPTDAAYRHMMKQKYRGREWGAGGGERGSWLPSRFF